MSAPALEKTSVATGSSTILRHRYFNKMRTMLLLILRINSCFPGAFGIVLDQTVPASRLACPGESLTFMCVSETGVLNWAESGNSHAFNTPNASNITGEEYTFVLIDVTGSTYVSTATDSSVSSADNGKMISCFDDFSIVSQNILVTVQPANCQGTVSCTANPSSFDSSLTVISVSLVAPSGQSCVEGYEFVFGNISKIVGLDSPAANFTIDKNLGIEYVNQQIFTLNAENVRGEQHCTFSITEPSAISQVTSVWQECNQTTMTITVFLDWDRPSLPVGNCLDASRIKWIYLVELFNFVPSTHETADTHIAIDGFPSSGEYSMMIIPTLPDLGLSGSPLHSTVVLTQTCVSLNNTTEPTERTPNTVTVAAISSVTVILIMLLVFGSLLLCCYYCYRKKVLKLQKEKDISIQEKQQTEALVADLQQKLEKSEMALEKEEHKPRASSCPTSH